MNSSESPFGISFDGRDDLLEMSRYIDLDIYHAVERSHPFYVEMIDEILSAIGRLRHSSSIRLLELGAGTGLATLELKNAAGVVIDALELDQKCYERLLQVAGHNVNCIFGDAVVYRTHNRYDFVVSVFSHDHISPDQSPAFIQNIRSNLKPEGYYLMGGEILPPYANHGEHVNSLKRYHRFIVDQCLQDGNFELAQIEINALKSGVHKIGDFKRQESQFESEMLAADFKLTGKTKIGPTRPDNVGGVFVYVWQAV